jgi:eukaryotic-like serine/threonine-protein kinase
MGTTAVAALVALALAWAYLTRQPRADARVLKFSILPPEKSSFGHIAVSPDGRHLAFAAATGGKVQLWVRALDSTEARALAGTQGATFPFWSPDSHFVGFFADGRLKKIEVTGGPVQTLYEASLPLGGAWSRDGVILFGPQPVAGLLRISATGGEVTQVTTRDRSRQENSHRYPTFLPDGRHFLYRIASGQEETRGVYLGSLDGTLKRRLLDYDTPIKYMAAVPNDTANGAGWLVFGRDGALLARPFDTSRLDFTGEPFLLSDIVGVDANSVNYFTFSVSDNGVLIFDPSANRQRRQYLWLDRHGQRINSLDVAAGSSQPWLSPDEKRFIADRIDPHTSNSDLWLYDVSGGNPQRFTFDPASDINPVWAPDGSRIVWGSTRDVMRQVSNGGGSGPRWRRDGRELFYYAGDGKLMAAPVRSSESFETGAAVSLFEFRAGTVANFAPYAVTGDGQRFLINAIVDTEQNAPLTVVVNWAAEVKD